MSEDLDRYKKELLTFLRESTANLERRATTEILDVRTAQDRDRVRELIITGVAYVDLAILVQGGAFDG